MTRINIVLFDMFETLDAFGPAEMMDKLPDGGSIGYFSQRGGQVVSSQQLTVVTESFADMDRSGVLLIPGGMGTRTLVDDEDFIAQLRALAEEASFVLTVCTGSGLLAKTGLLDGRRATSNKRAFEWVRSVGEQVNWIKSARWVVDGKFYTSSGVSAGTDMALGFIADRFGLEAALDISDRTEYIWNADKDFDPFAID